MKQLEQEAMNYWDQLEKRAKEIGRIVNLNVIRDLIASKFKTRFKSWKAAKTWATDFVASNYHLSEER